MKTVSMLPTMRQMADALISLQTSKPVTQFHVMSEAEEFANDLASMPGLNRVEMTTTQIEAANTDMRGALAPGRRKNYVLAGNATITIRSPKGNRFTFKVQKHDTDPVWFVRLLNGSDNTGDYVYLGTLFDGQNFRHTKKSAAAPTATSFQAFTWFSKNMEDARVEVWHEGHCGRCGRTLTVPESIESGIGPTCAEKGM